MLPSSEIQIEENEKNKGDYEKKVSPDCVSCFDKRPCGCGIELEYTGDKEKENGNVEAYYRCLEIPLLIGVEREYAQYR